MFSWIWFYFSAALFSSLTHQVRAVKSSDGRPACSPHPPLSLWLKLLFPTPDHSSPLWLYVQWHPEYLYCVIPKPNFTCCLLSQFIVEVFWPNPWRDSCTIILSNLASNPLTSHVGVCFQICPDYDNFSSLVLLLLMAKPSPCLTWHPVQASWLNFLLLSLSSFIQCTVYTNVSKLTPK